MKRTVIKMSCAVSLCLSSQLVLAQDRGVETTAGSSQPSVKQGADNTKSQNSMGQAMSYMTGGMYLTQGAMDISAGSAPCYESGACGQLIKGIFEVALGVMSMKQGGAHGSAAGQAGITGIQTDGFGLDAGMGSVDPMDPRNPDSPLNKDAATASAFSNLDKLQKDGILNLKKGTITAGGKTFKVSDFSSPSSMAAAGLPKGAIDGLMAYSDAVNKKIAEKYDKMKLGAMTASTGYQDGGGSGGESGSGGMGSDSGSGLASTAAGGSGGLNGIGRDPSSMAGMQKNYNGEPIGVAADSIFLMMNRRYKVKESQESFFTDAELALQK